MLAFLAIIALALLLPPVLRFLRALFVLHLAAVVLFLPAGLLLRLGNRDMATYAMVTLGWGALLVACYALRRARRRAERQRPTASGWRQRAHRRRAA